MVRKLLNINLQNLTFKYEDQAENLFERLNLTFDTDWKTGLIGREWYTFKKDEVFNIVANEKSKSGYPRLKTESGYYITAKKKICRMDIICYNINDKPRTSFFGTDMS